MPGKLKHYESDSATKLFHDKPPEIILDKSTLELYLIGFREAILNRKPNFYDYVKIVIKILLTISILVTSDFKDFMGLDKNNVFIFYVFVIAIFCFTEASDLFKRDESKYKTTDPEKMADVIIENCNKQK